MDAKKQNKTKKEEIKEVIYLDLNMIKKLSAGTKEKLLEEIQSMNCKVYTSSNYLGMLRHKKAIVHRFGVLPSSIAGRLISRGIKILPGDF